MKESRKFRPSRVFLQGQRKSTLTEESLKILRLEKKLETHFDHSSISCLFNIPVTLHYRNIFYKWNSEI